jgi:hypothetical protein
MIDRAALAGAAVGVGLLLIGQQVFSESPSWVSLGLGIAAVVLGAILWSDLHESSRRESIKRRLRKPLEEAGIRTDEDSVAAPFLDEMAEQIIALEDSTRSKLEGLMERMGYAGDR